MLCIGKRAVKTKDGRDMVVISAIGRRISDGQLYTDQIWTNHQNAELVTVGDQFRPFKDGGLMKVEVPKIDTSWMNDIM